MKYRKATQGRLGILESRLSKLKLAINTGNENGVNIILDQIREDIEQINLYIEAEPTSNYELNK